MNCLDCDRRDKCVKLCDKAEKYVNQDETSQWGDISFMASVEDFAAQRSNGLSTCEAILQDYFLDRRAVGEIARRYEVSDQYTRRIIRKYKALLVQNLRQ